MRRMTMGMVTMLVVAISAPRVAYSLTRNDTMMDWLHASDADRSRFLDDLQAKDHKPSLVSRQKVIDCMNGAAQIAGHRELHIGDVAEACSAPADGKAPTDI